MLSQFWSHSALILERERTRERERGRKVKGHW